MENINIFRVKDKKSDKAPDYSLSYYDKNTSTTLYVGSGWVKEGKNGKYISVQFNKPYNGKKGYKLVEYGEEKGVQGVEF
jgi:uncharacterized protein (DUF736 family)